MDNPLSDCGIHSVYHYAPLHYLVFIAREGALLSKPNLRERGFYPSHFRRTSRQQDEERGFGEYVHLTLREQPQIVMAKLQSGFPHFEIRLPSKAVEAVEYHLCRFNIAKCRYLKRPGGSPLSEGPINGRFYGNKQIPISITKEDSYDLIRHNYPHNMIEVLIPIRFTLPPETELIFFSGEDHELAEQLVSTTGRSWRCVLSNKFRYTAASHYRNAVLTFLNRAKAEVNWRGDGLEYDSV